MRDRVSPRVGQRRFAVVRSSASVWRRMVRLEPLETRELLSAGGLAETALDSVFAVPAAHSAPGVTSPVPYGDTPDQIRKAYGFDQVTFSNGTQSIAGDGSGQTIAIVDAYGDSAIKNDLHTFDNSWTVPLPAPPNFKVVNQNGGTKLPGDNSGWALETALDVEWAHATAPAANLLLVEASTSSLGNLLTAVNYARQQPGVVAVSMSWGTNEFSGETAYDSYFTSPSSHGVTFVAASGDNGAPAIWPAVSPNVLSVGGTTLTLNSSGGYGSETGWSGSGGGVSQYELQPTYQSQSHLVSQSATYRTSPDVSYNADPNSGVAVYDSISYSGQSGWFQVGGTSAAAPQWAALVAVADQGRQIADGGTADPLPNAQASVYNVASNALSYSNDFHDVTTGSNGSSALDTAGIGYDLVTGLGTPKVALLVPSLVQAPVTNVVTTASSATKTGSGASPSTTVDPSVIAELILLNVPLIDLPGTTSGPVVVPSTPPAPAPAASLVMPAETPVQLASNSLLTDDPAAVPFKPVKRPASAPSDATDPSDASAAPGATGVDRVWEQIGQEALVDAWLSFSRTTSPVDASAADAVFAESTTSEWVTDAAGLAGEFVVAADARAQHITGAIGLVVAAVLLEKGSRAERNAPTLARRRASRHNP